jgi:hypothetical protein
VGSLCFSFTTIIQKCSVARLQNNPKTGKTTGENLNLQVQNLFIFGRNTSRFKEKKK